MKTYKLPIELIIQMPAPAIHSKSVPLDVVKKLKKAGINAEMEDSHQPTIKKQGVASRSINLSGNSVTVKTDALNTGSTRVVGRIPDITGQAKLNYVETVIDSIVDYKLVKHEKFLNYLL